MHAPLAQNIPTTVKLMVFLFLSFLFGILIACMLIYLYWIGIFVKWHSIGQAPQNSVEIIGGDEYSVFIRSEKNKVFACGRSGKEKDCIPVDAAPSYSQPASCDFTKVAFSPVVNPPKHIISCIQIQGSIMETGYVEVFALTQDGILWKWYTSHHSLEIVLIPLVVVAGGVGGALLGSIVWVIRQLIQKRIGANKHLFSISQLVLLAIPWLCLILSLIALFILFLPPH